ncbi:MAG: taurine dioxygenase, partial [Actinomycetota bacterium]
PRVPADWIDTPYSRFGVEPLTPTIGAVITGVSLADELDEELFRQLNRALLEWKVLFFRGQDITGRQHADFAAHWGPLEAHPFIKMTTAQDDAKPEVVRFEKGADLGGYENVWHSDVTWREIPSLGSVLRAIEVPDVGGDTMWADMCAAYDGLNDATKEQIDGLVAEHDWLYSFGLGMDPKARDELRRDFPAVQHPIVRTHPETGRKMLYVNRGFTQFIVGMDAEESRALLERLWIQASFGEYQCRWKWQPGDVAFWDNRSTQHYAISDYFPNRRVMERITIIGDRPA